MGATGPVPGTGGRPRKEQVRRPNQRKPRSALVSCDPPANLPILRDNTPATLGDAGRDAWNELAPTIPGFHSHLDRPILQRFCELCDEREAYRQALSDHGALLSEPIVGPKGDVLGNRLIPNPAIAALRGVDRSLEALTVQLALSPAARVRLGLNMARGGEMAAYLIAEMDSFTR
jgi:P27 family predicted phage terminase small subunit